MPTDIYFAGENMRVKVDEEPGQVADAFASAHGLPCRLTAPGDHRDVYVNPSMVAFWLVSEPSHELKPSAEPPEASPQPTKRREIVTDIWGRPLRKPRG